MDKQTNTANYRAARTCLKNRQGWTHGLGRYVPVDRGGDKKD